MHYAQNHIEEANGNVGSPYSARKIQYPDCDNRSDHTVYVCKLGKGLDHTALKNITAARVKKRAHTTIDYDQQMGNKVYVPASWNGRISMPPVPKVSNRIQ